jgi:modification methylase nspV
MLDKKKEHGDYQTPLDFANKVVKYIKDNYDFIPNFIIEPNCGIGNFFKAAEQYYKSEMLGIEINKNYSEIAKKNNPKAMIYNQSIFEYKWEKNIKKFGNVLILGNPPWITNTELGKLGSENLPQKKNFKKHKGLEALSGMSNFDISEFIILNLLNKFSEEKFILAMLCKKSVAINIFKEMYRTGYKSRDIKIINFDSKKVFNINVSACLLIIDSSKDTRIQKELKIYSFDNSYIDKIGYSDSKLFLSSNYSSDLDGKCEFEWRQGIKHDCSKVCELELEKNIYINGLKEKVEIEDDLVYPLIKSSHIRNFKKDTFKKYVLVTQKK